MKQLPITSAQRQGGATLVIALIFMVILALLGATVATNNTMQERMASNTRNRDLAFQVAERALSYAETQMSAGLNYASAATVYPVAPAAWATGKRQDNGHANDAAFWSAFDWATNGVQPAGFVAANGVDVRYVVERMAPVNFAGPPAVTANYFRVTARGTGPNNAVAIIQIMYRN